MDRTFDAVVVGAGINGLVAAAELAQRGWSVAVVERNAELGGFIASGEITAPGFIHDTFSSWHPEFISGGAYATLGEELHRHGLKYLNTDGYFTGTVRRDGSVVLAHRDPRRTADAFAIAADRGAYLQVLARVQASVGELGGLMGAELRSTQPLKLIADLARGSGRSGLEALLRDATSGGRGWCRRTFAGDEIDVLWVPWLLHAGLSPDNAAGGVMIPLFAFILHAAGLPLVEGGQAQFLAAVRGVLDAHGAELFLGQAVEHVIVEGGRAVGVSTGAHTVRARRAVIASVAPKALYHDLLPSGAVAENVLAGAARYRPGRAAMQIHVALSKPLAWRDERLATVPLLHLGEGSASTAIACAEAEAGLLPREATIVLGQQSVVDPSRVPNGGATLWIQLQEVPFTPLGDAAGELDARGAWSLGLTEGYVKRILDRIETHAPGLHETVVGMRALTPADLLAHNPNAIFGDPYGGSAELDQRLMWRPFPAAARHATQVDGLWHIGAATHPGAGLGGGSGHLVAQALLRPSIRSRAGAAIRARLTRA